MYALVDCNNFFVSCERVFRPQLEGKAVVVLSNNDGCVVSRSNEAKAMGIRMCTPFYQIRDMVDSGRVIACSSNYNLYGDLSHRVMTVLSEVSPSIEIYSIDEAYLCLDGVGAESIGPMCSDLIRRIRKWIGIPVSIGVAPTKTLAKIASHYAKSYRGYHGLCMIDSEEKRLKALAGTPVGDVWGIGRSLSVSMEKSGIRTALDLASRPEEWVKSHFMLQVRKTWHELNGKACIDDSTPERRKSICTSRSFAEMVTGRDELASRVSDFAARCAAKLRSEHSAAGVVTVFLYTNRFRDDLPQYCPSASRRLEAAASSTQEIVSAALSLTDVIFRPGYSYKKAGVIVDEIVDECAVQLPMFGYSLDDRMRHDRISQVMDSINGQDRPLVSLASQSRGNYSDGIRCDYRSRRYSTSLDEIIEVH